MYTYLASTKNFVIKSILIGLLVFAANFVLLEIRAKGLLLAELFAMSREYLIVLLLLSPFLRPSPS